MPHRRRQLRLRKLRFLLDQLADDDLSIEISLQHLSGQRLLERRIKPLAAIWVGGDQRRAARGLFQHWKIPTIHTVTTLTMLSLYPPSNVTPILLPITWAASLGVTMLIWMALNPPTFKA